jgi:vacuolar protein sorting-associated protein 54
MSQQKAPGSNGMQADDDDYEHLRQFAGYNLTSVINNPKESTYDFLMETFYPQQEEFVTTTNIAPHPDLEAITMKDFDKHLATARLAQKFKRSRAQPMDSAVRAAAAATAMAEAEHNVIRCFEQIPKTFFDPDFTIEGMIRGASTDHDSTITMQDDLSQHLDLVEVTLMNQISSKSESFFAAMNNQEQLQLVVSESCAKVTALRGQIKSLQTAMVTNNLRLTQLSCRKKNTAQLHQKMRRTVEIMNTEKKVEVLLNKLDYQGALNLIDSAQHVLNTELGGVHCLRKMGNKLKEYKKVILDRISHDYVTICVNSDFGMGEDDLDEAADIEKQLAPIVKGLLKMGKMAIAVGRYKTELMDNVRIVVRTVVKDHTQPDHDGEGVADQNDRQMADSLKNLPEDVFLSCMECVYEHLLMVLRRAASIHEFLKGVNAAELEQEEAGTAQVQGAGAGSSEGGGGVAAEEEGPNKGARSYTLHIATKLHITPRSQQSYSLHLARNLRPHQPLTAACIRKPHKQQPNK